MQALRMLGKVKGVPSGEANIYTLEFTASSANEWRGMWERPMWRYAFLNPRTQQCQEFKLCPIAAGTQNGLSWHTPYRFRPEEWGVMQVELCADFFVDANIPARPLPPQCSSEDLPVNHFAALLSKAIEEEAARKKARQRLQDKTEKKGSPTKLPGKAVNAVAPRRGKLKASKGSQQQSSVPPLPVNAQLRKKVKKKGRFRPYTPPQVVHRIPRMSPLQCLLCGAVITAGTLLDHRAQKHGELRINPSPAKKRVLKPWISIVQGGLPGLGRRR